MNCNATSISSIISKPEQSTKARIHESISLASQISIPIRARSTARVKALYDQTVESPYEVLGIEESGSTLLDIKKAYKEMARKYHPDVSPPERVDENTKRFIKVKEAYEILTDPHRSDLPEGHEQEKGEWKKRWQSQVDELKRRSNNSSRMTWGARMRAHNEA